MPAAATALKHSRALTSAQSLLVICGLILFFSPSTLFNRFNFRLLTGLFIIFIFTLSAKFGCLILCLIVLLINLFFLPLTLFLRLTGYCLDQILTGLSSPKTAGCNRSSPGSGSESSATGKAEATNHQSPPGLPQDTIQQSQTPLCYSCRLAEKEAIQSRRLDRETEREELTKLKQWAGIRSY